MGQAELWVTDDLRCVLAPNPGPMTQKGTNTFILGRGRVAVIDPGPDIPAHMDAILAALDPGERVEAIICTHSHIDHSPLSRALSARVEVPVQAFGRHDAARSPLMEGLGDIGGGEGLDLDFEPDILLKDGQIVEGQSWSFEVVHTPGHLSNHIALATGDRMLCGDHVMGWSTTVISPPDGDLRAFMASLDKCLARDEETYYPGHGKKVANPKRLMESLKSHRKMREGQILDALLAQPDTIDGITKRLYVDVDPALVPVAARNVLAHIIDLYERDAVTCDGAFSIDAAFAQR